MFTSHLVCKNAYVELPRAVNRALGHLWLLCIQDLKAFHFLLAQNAVEITV